MSALIPSLTASLPGARPQPPQASAPAAPGTRDPSRSAFPAAAQSPVQPVVPPSLPSLAQTPANAPAAARLQPPAWPHPGAVNLLPTLIGLSETQITRTDTLTLPETAPDFWDMLATALPGEG